MKSVPVYLLPVESNSYEVLIGSNLLQRVGQDLRQQIFGNPGNYVVITDEHVQKKWGSALQQALAGLPLHQIVIAAGEQHKTRATKESIEDQMLQSGIGRDSLIIAFGGGVVSDLAGYVAATYQRGLPYITIPTTLLAAADASIGGKTGVNTNMGKNLIGAFYQPRRVYIDIGFWQTLPKLQLQNGMAETIKHAVIKDLPFFRWLEKHAEDFSAGFTNTNLELWKKLACKNVEIKSGIFQLDEREQSGQRERLNFGHTIAHALEKASNYKLLHGLAVGLGMIVEAEISVKLGIARPKDAERLRALVKNYGLPVRIPHQLKVEDIITHTKHDKKSRHGEARYVLLAKLGQVGQIASDQGFVEDAIVRQVILNNQA